MTVKQLDVVHFKMRNVFYFVIWVKTDSYSTQKVLIDGKLREFGLAYTTVHVNIFSSCLKDMTCGNHTSVQSQVQWHS